jgi:hypothetical protein
MSSPSGTGRVPAAGMRLTELRIQIGYLRPQGLKLPAQRRELGSSLIPAGCHGPVQFRPQLGNLLCQISHRGSSFRNGIRGGTDEHPLARTPHHQTTVTETPYRSLSCAVDGMADPTGSSPAVICRRRSSATCWYAGRPTAPVTRPFCCIIRKRGRCCRTPRWLRRHSRTALYIRQCIVC